MFSVGQKVVYPGHGVAVIKQIVEKMFAGRPTKCFELEYINQDMTGFVSVASAPLVGLRGLSSVECVEHVLDMLSDTQNCTQNEAALANWNKRNKEYQGKISQGDLKEICEIYRDLKYIENFKELSFGEKGLLSQTESLLVEEIAQVKGINEEQVIELLRMRVAPISRAGSGMSQETQK